MQQRFSQQPKAGLKLTVLASAGFLLLALLYFLMIPPPPSGGPGYILDGSSARLNPDGGKYMSRASGDGAWSLINNEYREFEPLSSSGGANQPWQPLPNYGPEPTGSAVPQDVQAGGGCGNVDITTDSDGDNDYAYFSVIDPDGVADNGDEWLALAMRLADEGRGAFSFSFLLDAKNDCGFDANATCGNPGFEYEIQIVSQRMEVNVINIDGCSGRTDCDALNGNGGSAYVCNPCNQEVLQVQAGSSECRDRRSNPVFWMAYVAFSQLAGVSTTDEFRLVPVTTTSPNSVIYQNTNVADYGGVGDPQDVNDCDCATQCAGQSCGECLDDCALACAATRNRPAGTFPVEWLELAGTSTDQGVALRWATAQEFNSSHFEVERIYDDGRSQPIGSLPGSGNSQAVNRYTFLAPTPETPTAIYRIKQIDYDGGFTYSPRLEVGRVVSRSLEIKVLASEPQKALKVSFLAPATQVVDWQISNLSGQQLLSGQQSLQPGTQVISLPEAQLPAGLYLLMVNDPRSGEQRSQKFRVQ
jgi:hypothetical protein